MHPWSYPCFLLSARTVMWSMPVVLTEWQKREWFAESMKIIINTVIFMHLCHLALDQIPNLQFHCRVKTCDSHWFSVILNDSWQFSVILNDSQWFVNQSEIGLGQFSVILDDSWTTLKTFLGWFLMILGDSWWFSVICKPLWKLFWVILDDS